jgi:hypothetical protein
MSDEEKTQKDVLQEIAERKRPDGVVSTIGSAHHAPAQDAKGFAMSLLSYQRPIKSTRFTQVTPHVVAL